MIPIRIGICLGPESLQEAYDAGYAFAELSCGALLFDQDEAAFAPVRKQLRQSPIPIEVFNCFLPASCRVTGPDVDLVAVGRHMDLVLRRAGEVGASIVVLGSGGARKLPEGWPREKGMAQFVVAARMAGERGAKHGITIVLEPLLKRACNFFNRTDEGSELVDLVNHSHVKLLADLYHCAWESEPFENLLGVGSKLFHVHLATPCLPELGDDGGPGYDLRSFLSVLAQAGYTGRLSVEDNPGLLNRHSPPRTNLYRLIREHVEREGQQSLCPRQ